MRRDRSCLANIDPSKMQVAVSPVSRAVSTAISARLMTPSALSHVPPRTAPIRASMCTVVPET